MKPASICVWAAGLTIAFLGGLCPAQAKKGGRSSQDGQVSGPVSSQGNISGAGGAKLPAADEKLIERVVTGVGTDPEKALQAAFSQAIESTVGVLVDAETIVKNNQIIKEQILTFSRGFVQKFDVVKQWQADGLCHATIKAVVETGKLTEKLKANKIATHDVPGELIARQIRFDVAKEGNAAEMFKKALDGFDMTTLTKVELDGKPEVARKGGSATMNVVAKVSPDQGKWAEFSKTLYPLLDKTATRRVAVTSANPHRGGKSTSTTVRGAGDAGRGGKTSGSTSWTKQLKGEGVLVASLSSVNVSGDELEWTVFRVPEPVGDVLKTKARGEKNTLYYVVFVLVTQDGTELARTKESIGTQYTPARPLDRIPLFQFSPAESSWWVGPVWVHGHNLRAVWTVKASMQLTADDLAKVAKVNVFLQQEKTR